MTKLGKRIGKTAVVLTAIIMSASSVWGWGPLGHRVASRMAQERLTPAALSAVHAILGPGISLADISTWADEQREITGNQSWHYVNVPLTQSRYDPKYCPPGGCVVSKIEDFRRVLQNPKSSRAEKQYALEFLVHLIEDLCQPLHVGDNGSKGGNLIQVQFYGIGSNLHKLWDSQIMERHTPNEGVWLWDLNGVTNPKFAAEWAKGTPEDWASESLQIARQAYCLPGSGRAIRSGTRIGNDYYSTALPLIQKQLAKAGIRVASVLNGIFG
jgi:nuclease S1